MCYVFMSFSCYFVYFYNCFVWLFFFQLSKKEGFFCFPLVFSVSAIICIGLCSFFVSFLRVPFFCILYFFLIFTIKSDCAVA